MLCVSKLGSGSTTFLLFPCPIILNPVSSQSITALRSSPCSHIEVASLAILRIFPVLMSARCKRPRVSAVQVSHQGLSSWLRDDGNIVNHVPVSEGVKVGVIHSVTPKFATMVSVVNVEGALYQSIA